MRCCKVFCFLGVEAGLVSGVWGGIWCNVKNICAGASEYDCTI